METATLEQQWEKIDLNSDHRSVRLPADCKPNLFIGFDNQNNRRLILSLTGQEKLDINDDVREYIAIQYFDLSRHLIVTLHEERFRDVFNAFILSVFNKVKHLVKPVQAATEIVQIYTDWNEFFSERTQQRLDLPSVMGLFGELFLLFQELEKAGAA
ncbi:MAG: PD-(D/E)XK motif protein, partial [Chitinophagaceae bacterium]